MKHLSNVYLSAVPRHEYFCVFDLIRGVRVNFYRNYSPTIHPHLFASDASACPFDEILVNLIPVDGCFTFFLVHSFLIGGRLPKCQGFLGWVFLVQSY